MSRSAPQASITFEWDASSKRWKMTYRCTAGKGWATHWMWVETTAPIDPHVMRELALACERQLSQFIF